MLNAIHFSIFIYLRKKAWIMFSVNLLLNNVQPSTKCSIIVFVKSRALRVNTRLTSDAMSNYNEL
jgi:hypothetical protein